MLFAWGGADEQALKSLVSIVYPEVRRIARRHLDRRQAGHTLESAVLANEAYLRLVRAGGIRCESRVHFLALCSSCVLSFYLTGRTPSYRENAFSISN
jgi:hypothetical protein